MAHAVALLRAGEVVALPTETVYGLAADALSARAVVKIFETKERPHFDPLIVHLPQRDWLERVAVIENGTRALIEKLIAAFWPGPLTIVVPRTEIIPSIVTAGLTTVAVRMSAHPLFAEVVQAFGQPLAAPSANRFGRISPTSAADVAEELSGRIPLIVDGGATHHGIESTVVAPRDGKIEVLRSGPITREQLAKFGEVRSRRVSSADGIAGAIAVALSPANAAPDCGGDFADRGPARETLWRAALERRPILRDVRRVAPPEHERGPARSGRKSFPPAPRARSRAPGLHRGRGVARGRPGRGDHGPPAPRCARRGGAINWRAPRCRCFAGASLGNGCPGRRPEKATARFPPRRVAFPSLDAQGRRE